MSWLLGLLIAQTFLCPKLDTGRFFFKEYLYLKGALQDSFKGIFTFNGDAFQLHIEYPEKQLYYNSGDSLFSIIDMDTSVMVRPNLEKLLKGEYSVSFRTVLKNHKCLLLPVSDDTAYLDSILLIGNPVHRLTVWVKEGKRVDIILQKERWKDGR